VARLPVTPISEDEYLRRERLAETKSEFHDGEVFAMSGGTFNHSVLTTEMIVLLSGRMAAGCWVCSADLRIKIAESKLYTYPDCSGVCGEPEFAGDQKDCLLNPMLIVEVLSPGSEGYDRGKKFEMYRTMKSLREYVVVHQTLEAGGEQCVRSLVWTSRAGNAPRR
jgi:Uma2 family endonuclease